MKKFLITTAAFGAMVASHLAAQTVFTVPAGYVTLHADAATSTTEPTTTFVSHSLARELVFSGTTSSGSGSNTVEVSGASWTANQFAVAPDGNATHFVIIKTGDRSGQFYDILSNTSDILTVSSTPAEDFSDLVSASPAFAASISIYKHSTLASVFGEDPTLITDSVLGGTDSGLADNILFFDSSAGGFTTYFFLDRPAFPPAGITAAKRWVSTSSDDDAANTIIYPDDGLVYTRRSIADLNITIFGEVLNSEIEISNSAGTNLVSIPFPVDNGLTLATSGLRPEDGETFNSSFHLQGGTDSGVADRLLFWNGSGYDTYFFLDRPAFPPAGITAAQKWVSTSSEDDAGDTPIPDGGFFLVRLPNSPTLKQRFQNLVSDN